MGVEKMSVSFDLKLGEAIRRSAISAGQSASAWLAQAARDRLRLDALSEAVSVWEQEHGALTETEVARAEAVLDEPKGRRRTGAA